MASNVWSPLGLEQDLAAMREGEPLADHSVPGIYSCATCGAQLYDSVTKVSSTAFPTFKRAILVRQLPPLLSSHSREGAVDLVDDFSFGMRRTAALCAKCKSPIGHVYKEGKAKQRHVLLSRALKFREDEEQVEEINARNAGVTRQPSVMRRLEPVIAAAIPVLVVAALIWLRRRSAASE